MRYNHIKKAVFLERPNRFIAKVAVDGLEEIAHVKNTGRCKELLLPGAVVYLEGFHHAMGSRKTAWDLVAVEKAIEHPDGSVGSLLINMDSQAPNKVVAEALQSAVICLPDFAKKLELIRFETSFGNSRFDFYVEGARQESAAETGAFASMEKFGAKGQSAYIEVKGVTLEEDGVCRFPDAPTVRGVKHIHELCKAKAEGFSAYIIFVVQMQGMKWLEPNDATHPEFGIALREAKQAGVQILAYDCIVTVDCLKIRNRVPVML